VAAERDTDIGQESRPQVPGPGADLRRAREAAGLSTEELAGRLHLGVGLIEDLEGDRFDSLPQPAYVRGYLRAAARALGIDATSLIEAYDAQGLSEPRLDAPPAVARSGVAPANRGHRKAPYVLGLAILVALAGLIAYGWFEGQDILTGARDAAPTTRAPLTLQTPAPPEPALHTLPDAESPDGSIPEDLPPPPGDFEPQLPETHMPVEEPPVELVPAPPPPPAQTAQPAPAPEPASPATADTSVLVLRFAEDSWVEISDARGDSLLVGLMREGTERRLQGMPPYRVFLGNAPGVRIEHDGSNYDAGRHARADNTARFTLERP
jgi:cytoskeleton protein RodZ